MDRMIEGKRFGILVHEFVDDKGKSVAPNHPKAKRVPPRFFGRIIEAAADGRSGYGDLEKKDEPGVMDDESRRVHFHIDEIEDAPELETPPAVVDVEPSAEPI